MAPDPLSLASYEHHHHHLLPHQQLRGASLPNAPPESFQSRRPDVSNLHSTSPGGQCMTPTWHGFVHTTFDALVVLEACLQGKLSHIPRRPHDRERASIIVSGNVFIYEENASGIKRWTDGVTWSPSRIMGNFLVYRELSEPFPAGEKKKAKKRKRGNEEAEHIMNMSAHTEEDRKLVGSLVDSYGFKPNGLIKKTLNVKYKNVNHHIVSYYNLEDVKAGVYSRPNFDPVLIGLQPREDLMKHNFKVNAVDPDEDILDPFQAQPVLPIQSSGMYSQPPSLRLYTDGHGMTTAHDTPFSQLSNPVMSQSPHTALSASCTPVEFYHQYPFTQTTAQYLTQNMVDGLAQVPARNDRVDSVIGGPAHYKSDLTDISEMPVFSATGSDSSSATALTHPHSLSTPPDIFAVHGSPTNYDSVEASNNWSIQAAPYHESLSMPQPKRRQTAPVMQLNHPLSSSLMSYGQPLHTFSPPLASAGGGAFVV